MRRVTVVLLVALVAGVAAAQQSGTYTPAENPYQADLSFTAGKPVDLFVEIDGVRFDGVTVLLGGEIRPGEQLPCEVEVIGASVSERKATVNVVLLLEDAEGKPLERVTLDAFKVKSGKAFDVKEKRSLPGSSLAAATTVYLFVQVSF